MELKDKLDLEDMVSESDRNTEFLFRQNGND